MATEENQAQQSENKKEADSRSFDIKEFLSRAWRAKYWFLLSILVCCSVFYVRYLSQAPVYTSSSEVLFLFGNSQSSSGASTLQALSDLGVTTSQPDVNMYNEMQMFHSPVLMNMVVERLNLNTTYTTDDFEHNVDLYGQTPVIVNFLDIKPDESLSLTLRKSDKNHVIATNFFKNGQEYESKPLRIPIGSIVESPIGKISVAPTTDIESFPDYINVSRVPVETMAAGMINSVTTSKKENLGSIMLLQYSDINQKRANDVVNTLVEAYNDLWTEEQNRSAVNTSNFINERLAVIEKELTGIDTDISQVKSSSPMGATDGGSMFYTQSLNYDSQAYESATQMSIAQFLRDHIMNHPEAMIPANTGASGSIESQIQEYNKMLIKRDNLLQNSTAANPVIAQMNNDLNLSRQLILQSLGNIISTYRISASRAAGRGNSFAGKVTAVPEQERQILSIERQQKVKENLYLYLLQKREENELSRMITVNNTRVLRPASAQSSENMQLTKAMGMGLLIGLAIPLGIIFLLMQFNTKVTRKSDLSSLSIPFLGEMPMSPHTGKKKSFLRRMLHPRSRKVDDSELEVVVKERSRSYINEAFRMIRTSLDFMVDSEHKSEVIMLTSFNPGSGKTFITMNLAKSIALKNKRVLVVDVDLRRASLSKYAGNATQGITTFLTGKAGNIHDLIVKSDAHFGVDLLPVGAIPPNPVEQLLSKEFEHMITELRKEYDYILLDCPPYDLVADTAIIARMADITIFVIRAGLFSKSMLRDLEEVYINKKLPRMSIILNGIDPSKSYYNDRYGYKGHSGYYINDEEDKDDEN